MEHRQLGASGFKVPVLSLGTGTFGGAGPFKGFGESDAAEATRLVDICLDAGLTMFDSADAYSAGMAEEILGQAIKGRRDKVIISTKSAFRVGAGPERRRIVALSPDPRRRGEPEAARHRLHRPLSASRLRPDDAGRRDARHARRPGPRREDPLHRLLELLRLAPDEVAGRLEGIRAGALRGPPGVLFARRPRLRVGADAAGARPGRRLRRWSPLGFARLTGKIRRGQPLPETSRLRHKDATAGGPPVADEYLFRVVDALDAVAEETGKTVPQVAINWVLRRPERRQRHHRRPQRGAAPSEPGRGRLGADARAGRQARRRQRRDARLPDLAPAALRRAEPAAGLSPPPRSCRPGVGRPTVSTSGRIPDADHRGGTTGIGCRRRAPRRRSFRGWRMSPAHRTRAPPARHGASKIRAIRAE